jgi:protein-L-isoaspartate(D-aspartate) O-methyltransferase
MRMDAQGRERPDDDGRWTLRRGVSSLGDALPSFRDVGLLLLTLIAVFGTFHSIAAQPGSQQFATAGSAGAGKEPFLAKRQSMVEDQVRRRGVTERRLLDAMATVPRHEFVPESSRQRAYDDAPVELEPAGQALPQAYVSARMISLLKLDGDEKVLEIGTGSGYDSALLSRLAKQVYTIEIDDTTARRAERTLRAQGYHNIQVRVGDGYRGWPEAAPFEAILVTAAPNRIPEPLFEQLAIGGRMVVAVGFSLHQDLQVITKRADGSREVKRVSLISLAPMTGEVNQQP